MSQTTNNYKLEFTLKQHTPIIHFQHEQKGATLRATELKPKLDRFLIEKLGLHDEQGKPKDTYKSWFIAGQDGALDYKVRVEPNESNNISNPPKGLYFGKNHQKLKDTFKIEFILYKTDLKREIEKLFEEFIVIHSFGTRSNKGFGSFSLYTTSIKEYEKILGKYYDYSKLHTNDEKTNPIDVIKNYYQELKSGIGDPDRIGIYKDSKLMKYFSPNLLWEKQWIKKKIKEKNPNMFNDLKNDYHKDNAITFEKSDTKYRYIRYLFGSSAGYTFITNQYVKKIQEIESNNNLNYKEKKKEKKSAEKLKVYVSVKIDKQFKDTLNRFKSPISFKVFNNNIYIAIQKDNPIDSFVYDKKFHFNAYYKKNPGNKSYLGFLCTPKYDEFTQEKLIQLLFSKEELS